MMNKKWIASTALLFLVMAAFLAGCQETRSERNYVQANVYDKQVFQGDWFYVRTVVDHDYESSWMGYYGTFVGDQTWSTATGALERVTWIIDENYIYAYRTVPVVDGADSRQYDPDFREDPVAAFRIIDHFDVIKRYNPITGEELNVIEETETERPWYERQYMRVDWSQNLLTAYYWTSLDAFESYGYVQRESVPFYCGDGSDSAFGVPGSCSDGMDNDYDGACDVGGCEVTSMQGDEEITRQLPPDPACVADPEASEIEVAAVCKPEWRPVIRYTSQSFDDTYGTFYTKEFNDEGEGDLGEGIPYYFSFVTQEMWTPDPEMVWMSLGFSYYPISSVRISIRNSFLRTPDVPHYEPLNAVDRLWDRFGIIRLAQQVYMGGEGSSYDPNSPKCDPESDQYDPHAVECDPDTVINPDRGPVDFLNYWGARHNIWVDYKDADGNIIPPESRQVRKIVYYLNPGFPKWLIPSAFDVMDQWNRTLMDAVSLTRTGSPAQDPICTVEYGSVNPQNASRFSEFDGMLADPGSTPAFQGADCVLVLRVNSFDLPDGEYQDSAGTRVIARDAVTGAIDPQISSVDPYGEQMGDLRFKFMSVIDTPGAAFSGVSLPMQDLRNGELIQANFNITRESYEWVMTDAIINLSLYADLCQSDGIDFSDATVDATYRSICIYLGEVMNDIDLPKYLTGEYAREYFANLGKVSLPVSPIVPEALSGAPVGPQGQALTSQLVTLALESFKSRLEQKAPLMNRDARALLKSDRVMNLKGTEFEKILYDNPEAYILYSGTGMPMGPQIDPSAPVPEDVLDQISIMRKSFPEQQYASRKRFMNMLSHYMEPSNPYIDYSMMEIAKEFQALGYDANQIAVRIGQLFFKAVMLHEAGHSMGMEHNFAGSIDQNNYHDEYFGITNVDECMNLACPVGGTTPERELKNCWPCPDDISFAPYVLTVDQTFVWSNDVDRIERKREMLGMGKWETTSVMDYFADFHEELAGRLGKFDKAFTNFTYAGKVEAYVGDPRVPNNAGARLNNFLFDPTLGGAPMEKIYSWVYYLGGESCESDADCPYNALSGRLPDTQVAAGLTQKCVGQEHYPSLPHYCSEYFDDATDFVTKAGTNAKNFFPVIYRFCSNNRTYDISWCNMFDQGGSFREVVNNMRKFSDQYYPYSHFRRYQRLPNVGTYWFPYETMGKIQQHFLYRYFYEPEFQNVNGPLGQYDMLFSVYDSMNFFAQTLATPDVGSYKFAPEDNTYYKVSEKLGDGDLDIPLGMGKYMWSATQDGQFGVYEIERAGTLYDKLYALQAMLMREWGASYYYDERFWFNYYDIWTPNEVIELLASYILDDPFYYGARWMPDPVTGTQKVMYPQVFAPNVCTDYRDTTTGEWTDCNPSRVGFYPERPWEQVPADVPRIGSDSNVILRNYAVIISLAELPYFQDPTYERMMFICEKGSGYCIDICEQPDVTAGTAYYFCNDPEVVPLIPGEDFVTYTSQRLHKTFQAVQVEKTWAYAVKEIDIAMNLLRKADTLQNTYVDYTAHKAAGTCPVGFTAPCDEALGEAIDRVSNKLVETESFIVNVINIQRLYGISSWLI